MGRQQGAVAAPALSSEQPIVLNPCPGAYALQNACDAVYARAGFGPSSTALEARHAKGQED